MPRPQSKQSVLGRISPKLAISVLVGAQDVRVDGDQIRGRWLDRCRRYTDKRDPLLAETFVNLRPTREMVAAFTKRYGPLTGKPAFDGNLRPREFSFSMAEWSSQQAQLQKLWTFYSSSQHEAPCQFELGPSERQLMFNGDTATLTAESLWRFMDMELASAATCGVVRVCRNPDCKGMKFFIDLRGNKTSYCGVECQRDGKKQSKLRSYHANKHKWPSTRS